jgi:hypothetical protein
MQHDVALARKDGSAKHFRIYGRSTSNVGDIVTLPVDGQIVKARVRLTDHLDIDAVELDELQYPAA